MYDTPNLFPLLVHSLCPSIYGHEMIKAGLLLSLFGGNAERSKIRDNIHVLIVGDPGLGKSQMLQACARVAAKGITSELPCSFLYSILNILPWYFLKAYTSVEIQAHLPV